MLIILFLLYEVYMIRKEVAVGRQGNQLGQVAQVDVVQGLVGQTRYLRLQEVQAE